MTRLPTTRRAVALTFDGGAAAQGAAAVLAALAAAHVRATFFLSGDFAASNPDLVRRIARAGHVIGDHTMSHPHLTALPTAEVTRELVSADRALTELTGRTTRPWFRFPYGEHDARTLAAVHALGFGAIGWTVDTLGWEGRSAGTAADVVARVLAARRPGEIVLMHLGANPNDGTTFDADALPTVIADLRHDGYAFVTVDDV